MRLHRLSQTEHATFGQLTGDDSTLLGCTLEPPNRDNQPDISCIPAGTYECRRYLSPKRGYEVWELQQVPGRSAIEIHILNTPDQTEGCIGLGTAFGVVNGQHGITGSGDAFRHFMQVTRGVDAFRLTIIDPSADLAA